jgi:hypothetical protein
MCGPVGKDLLKIKCDVNAAVSNVEAFRQQQAWLSNESAEVLIHNIRIHV